jgi:cytochrome c oxidase subunit 2
MRRPEPARPCDAAGRGSHLVRGAFLAAAVGGCAGPQSALDPAGPYARSIATHWWAMLAVGALVFLAVLTLFAWAIWRAPRARPLDEPPAESGDDDATARAKTRAVGVGVGVAGLVLVGVLAHSVLVAAETATRPDEAEADVEVVGHQWWWEVRYLHAEPSRHVTAANELHLPVGRPVRVRLRAGDVIHSFWVPNLQGKIDMIPGRENTLRLLADRPGEWRGQCAEYCGLQHARMAFAVVAHPPAEYAAWRAREARPAVAPTDSLARAGAAVFLRAQCAYCHTVRGTPAAGSVGPDLTHVASRRTLAAGILPNTTGHRGGWILDPQSLKPGAHMPPTPLAGPELRALLAYLETLR